MGNRHYASFSFGFIALAILALMFPLFTHAASLHASLRASITEQLRERVCERQAALSSRFSRVITPSICAPSEPEEPTLSFTAEPMTIEEGEDATLEWNTENATSCTASDGWSGAKGLSGDEEVSPEETTIYTLVCSGEGGEVEKSVTVTVTPAPDAPTVDINAEPLSIVTGETSELSWSSANATSCTASNAWTGDKDTNGSENVSPTVTSTYAISCTGPGGIANDSVTVTVTEPEAATLTLVKTVVNNNSGTAVADDFQAMIDDENVAWDVATEVEPGAHTASETNLEGYAAGDWGGDCAADGTVTLAAGEDKTCTITNDDVEPEPDAPTLELSADRLIVNENSSSSATTTLSWDSTNADSCTASGASEWTGDKALDGTETLTPTADVTYELDCTGPGGSVHKEVVIDFVPAEPEPTEDHLLISEVHYDVASTTSGSEASNEWVEIYNPTNAPVNLQGWFVGDASSTDMIDEDVSIAAGGYVVVAASSTPEGVPEGVPVIVLFSSIGNNGFANGGDGARLLDASEELVDSVGYGTNTTVSPNVDIPGSTDGHSIQRVQLTEDTDTAADWEDTDTPTPGA